MIRKLKEQKGQSVVVVALALTALLGCAALAVDLGQSYVLQERMQNTADLAAIAAAKALPDRASAIRAAEKLAEENGIIADEITVNSPYNGDSNLVEVICAREVSFGFGKVFGKDGSTVRGRAVAKAAPMGGPFRYTIFSGSKSKNMEIWPGIASVSGGIHSNAGFSASGTLWTVGGDVEAVRDLAFYGTTKVSGTVQAKSIQGDNIQAGSKVREPANAVAMPDFSQQLIDAAYASGVYVSGSERRGVTGLSYQIKDGSGYAYYLSGAGKHGKSTYLLVGDNVVMDGPVFVDGDLLISCSSFTGNGFIIASGSIMLCTSCIRTTGSSVGIYSQNGDVLISISYTDFGNGTASQTSHSAEGLIYAPNGAIRIGISDFTFLGRLVANEIFFSGGNLDIRSTPGDLDCLPKTEVQLVE